MVVLVTCKYKKIPSKMKPLECLHDFPIITLWELSVAIKTRVLIQNLLPNVASDKIWLGSARLLRRYSCLKVLTYEHTHRRTDGQIDGHKYDTALLFKQLVLPYQHRCYTFSDNVSNVKLNPHGRISSLL